MLAKTSPRFDACPHYLELEWIDFASYLHLEGRIGFNNVNPSHLLSFTLAFCLFYTHRGFKTRDYFTVCCLIGALTPDQYSVWPEPDKPRLLPLKLENNLELASNEKQPTSGELWSCPRFKLKSILHGKKRYVQYSWWLIKQEK